MVEHFFRHEFGRLVAVLTRSLGVRRLEFVEDVVQAALVQAPPPRTPGGKRYASPLPAPIENSCIAASPSASPMGATDFGVIANE